MIIDQQFLDTLFSRAKATPRLRQNNRANESRSKARFDYAESRHGKIKSMHWGLGRSSQYIGLAGLPGPWLWYQENQWKTSTTERANGPLEALC